MNALLINLVLLPTLSSAIWAQEIDLEKKDFSAFGQLIVKEEVPPIRLTVRGLDGNTQEMVLGGSEGHGGDFKEMAIINIAWKVFEQLKDKKIIATDLIDRLQETITNLKVEIIDEVHLEELKRDAVNIPKYSKIFLSDEGYHYLLNKEVSLSERAQFLFHEILPIMGIDDSDYQASQRLVDSLSQEGPSTKDSYQELLYSFRFGGQFDGVPLDKAREICQSVKKANKGKFFALYCTYQEKYKPIFVSEYIYWPFLMSTYRHFELSGPIYGIKVMGFGRLEKLREVDVLNGRQVDMPSYSSAAEANYECTKIVATEDDHNFLYYKAKCEVFAFEEGYRFSIKSKNPLLQ